jgi:hypothetical protein
MADIEEYVRVKVTASSGDQSFTDAWRLRIEDADTGKLLLVLKDGLSIHEENGAIVLTGSMIVHELEIECQANLTPIVAGSPEDPVWKAID